MLSPIKYWLTGFIVSVFPFRNGVSFKEVFEGLELGERKLSRRSGRARAAARPPGYSVLIHAVIEMKQRNPNWGCPRIAQQMALAFHIQIDKDVVRRILAHHYLPGQDSDGPSWLTFLGHMKDNLGSIDLFRCESATLRTHWVLVVTDQYSRRIIGFGVRDG